MATKTKASNPDRKVIITAILDRFVPRIPTTQGKQPHP
jgi:hypothetical protein